MRISIREQLGLLVLFCSLMALMVLALATWFQNENFITNIRLSGLSLTASLKAAQISSTLLLYESQTRATSTRVLIQSALQRYNNGNDTNENWVRTQSDLQSALASGNLLVQATIFPATNTNNQTALNGLVNVTSSNLASPIKLPYAAPNGSDVYLGDPVYGYPPSLYPNLTYNNATSSVSYNNLTLDPKTALFLGPLLVNSSFALLSATTAVINNTSPGQILGWLTTVVDASILFDTVNSLEGLGDSGEVLIVGPESNDNIYPQNLRVNANIEQASNEQVRFVLPPLSNATVSKRHSQRLWPNSSIPFLMSSYPVVVDAWTKQNNAVNNAGATIKTHDEQDVTVSAGYAHVSTTLVDWVLLVEQDYSEVVEPINHLRDVVLICVFCTIAGLLLFLFPLAHYSIAPIRQLRAATKRTVEPYQPDDNASQYTQSSATRIPEHEEQCDSEEARKEGFMGLVSKFKPRGAERDRPTSSTRRRRTFRIPSKVPERKHWITDELTDLTSTFNEMSDELAMQYQRLEERVKERTAELERSKQEAVSANRSKTLFIANISHELKTPLNGILGLTTVCMNEDDPSKIRSTLNTIYKSGDLLLHLLTDLLTFSKNEVGQQLSIDEAEFRLIDLDTQLIPTFEKQAREGQIDLKVLFIGSNDAFGNTTTSEELGDNVYGPVGTGRVKDMCLWGDKNRILQVLMNFVSNSLKFTPPHGSVTVRIRCVGLRERSAPDRPESARKSSMKSQTSRTSSRKKVRTSETSLVIPNDGTPQLNTPSSNNKDDAKLSINVAGGTTHIAKVFERQRSKSPPPLNTKDLQFQFEVEDTGPGIPEDQQKKIFEPFVQGDLGLSKKYGGTGLGLSICAQLAGLMGGDISLDSKVGVGSKFIMRLPLRYTAERAASMASSRRTMSKASSVTGLEYDEPETVEPILNDEHSRSGIPRIVGFTQPYVAKEAKPEPPSVKLDAMKKAESEAAKDGRKVRVLVAEDNKINQEVVTRMLKLEDIYDVTIAKDGQEAFDKVRESMKTHHRFHLIFMDVQMPNVDGIQSTKLIRSMGFDAPIVALTAFAEKSNEDECMASGMDYFLAKPIKRPALKHVLKKYCSTIAEEEGEVSAYSAPKPTILESVRTADAKPDTNGVLDGRTDSGNVSPLS